MKSGIYKIKNKTNGKVYIGSSINMPRRFSSHLTHLRGGTHFNHKLQRDWNQNDVSVFVFSVLEYVEDVNLLSDREKYWIRIHDATDSNYGYNSTIGGKNNYVYSKEQRELRSKLAKDRWANPEYREKVTKKIGSHIREWNKSQCGVSLSDERKSKMSKFRTGKKHSAETKKKIAQAAVGRKHSPETIKKMISSHKKRLENKKPHLSLVV